MKYTLFLLALLMCLNCSAQMSYTYPLTIGAGNSTYMKIGGQDYQRAALGYYYTVDSTITHSATYDSVVTIYWQRDGFPLYRNVIDTMFYYSDSSKQVRNMGVLRTWLRTNAY